MQKKRLTIYLDILYERKNVQLDLFKVHYMLMSFVSEHI